MNRSQALKLLKGLSSKDYDIQVKIYQKTDNGQYNWLFNFEGGGFNNVWAKTRKNAIAIAEAKFDSRIDRSSFRKCTADEYDAQNRAGWMMSM